LRFNSRSSWSVENHSQSILLNKMESKQIATLFCLLILGAISLWARYHENFFNQSQALQSKYSPEFYIKTANFEGLDKNGKLKYQLDSSRVTNQGHSTYLTDPNIRSINDVGDLTEVSANNAVTSSKNTLIMRGNVILTQSNNHRKIKLVMTTDNALADFDQWIVSTKEKVNVKSDSGDLYGVGASFDKKNGKLRLMSNVYMSYRHPKP
jgi:LPS export ABC transporter protein LptC